MSTPNKNKILSLLWACLVISLLPGLTSAQDTDTLSAAFDPLVSHQADTVMLAVSLDGTAEVYYFESEVNYDPGRITFISAEPGELTGGSTGVSVAENLDYNTVGVSASRTSGTGTGPGSLIYLAYKIKSSADTGSTSVTFANPILKDSTGSVIPTTGPKEQSFTIKPSITHAGLSVGELTFNEAQSVSIEASVFSHSITDNTGANDNIRAWIGWSTTDSDPATWSESSWIPASHLADADGSDIYAAEAGPGLDVGTYFYAARFQLNNRPYRYAGIAADSGGFWDGVTYTSGILDVTERPAYRTKVAAWNFDDKDLAADKFTLENHTNVLSFGGARREGFDLENNGFVLATDSWHAESGSDSLKFIKFNANTEGFTDIQLNSAFKGTGSGPRDFQLQYSFDDSTWSDISGGLLTVTESWSDGTFQNLQLPGTLENRSTVYLRFNRIGDIRVDGNSGISTQGKIRVDNIQLTGIDTAATTYSVWPGDTDNDGSVSETDVLPLGNWWGFEGESRILAGTGWSSFDATSWRPLAATFADTDGNGVVNQSDLLAIGLNYDSQRTTTNAVAQNDGKSLRLPKLNKGEQLRVKVYSEEKLDLTGLSVTLKLNNKGGADARFGELLSITPVHQYQWTDSWKRSGRLLSFIREKERQWSAAWVHKGLTSPKNTNRLMTWDITAGKDWGGDITLAVDRMNVTDFNGQARSLHDEVSFQLEKSVNLEESNHSRPATTQLKSNFPNPFNPSTTIVYDLAREAAVTIEVFNLLGGKVATLVDHQRKAAGTHYQTWDASEIASGIYFYRLQTEGMTQTRKMLLMK